MSDISRSLLAIRIFGTELDPEQLTWQLGCEPSRAARKGDRLTLSNRKIRVVKEGYWQLHYSAESSPVVVEEQIATLLGKLTDDLAIWQRITAMYRVGISCGIFQDRWNEGFVLSRSLIRKLSDRNLSIDFDLYSPTDTWYAEDKPEE